MRAVIANSWIYHHAMNAALCVYEDLPPYAGARGNAGIRAQLARCALNLGPAPWWTWPKWSIPKILNPDLDILEIMGYPVGGLKRVCL